MAGGRFRAGAIGPELSNGRLFRIYSELCTLEIIARIHPRQDHWEGPPPGILDEHETIIDLLAANRTQEAQEVLRRHIRNAKKVLLARIVDGG